MIDNTPEGRAFRLANAVESYFDCQDDDEFRENFVKDVVSMINDVLENTTPTQDAYDAVCAARTKWQERAETAEAKLGPLK